MERNIFRDEHNQFRQQFRRWLEKEVIPHHEKWEEAGMVPREVWRKAGEQGFLCPLTDPKYGGAGTDFLYSAVVIEEVAKAGASGLALTLHSDICAPYIESFGTEEQKQRWLPGCVTGEKILAVAMTEPNAGSDLASIRTTALKNSKGYVLNGQKTFISNGQLCDLVVLAAKTDPKADPPYLGVSLFVVEAGTPGFIKGKRLKKIGMHAQDTSELAFEDCHVPESALLGEEGKGFYYLMQKLQQERLVCAVGAQAGAEMALQQTLEYTQGRTAFGKPISKFQNTRFRLVEMATELEITRAFLDRLIVEHTKGEPLVKETSMAKWYTTELLKRTIDQCLQFFGGYGYMLEYPIAKAYIDARVQTIFAGTTEIMKEIIGKQMGL